MLLKEWMTKDVITVSPQTSMMKAGKLLREHKFRRLPVVDERGCLVGIVTDRDIKDASPSKATALDVHELNYLLSEIAIADIMTQHPVTVTDYDTIQTASAIMLEKKFEGLPVVDDKGRLIGIITETDLFRALIHITGGGKGGLQAGFCLSSALGETERILELFQEHEVRVISMLTVHTEEDQWNLHIRAYDPGAKKEAQLRNLLGEGREMLYWVKDRQGQEESA